LRPSTRGKGFCWRRVHRVFERRSHGSQLAVLT
jgi:hypothetical protein